MINQLSMIFVFSSLVAIGCSPTKEESVVQTSSQQAYSTEKNSWTTAEWKDLGLPECYTEVISGNEYPAVNSGSNDQLPKCDEQQTKVMGSFLAKLGSISSPNQGLFIASGFCGTIGPAKESSNGPSQFFIGSLGNAQAKARELENANPGCGPYRLYRGI